ncbi:hypothetical protein G4Z16_16405 [Streptomyces bathyalis]|uniref:Uncharacterized protein n=1 Tax=Streptomyces bathyalis TaxID=2710756 RepID=A0A7T1T7C0_9ACTN|nr:hypothetical protein [Streptomyces bathyalis]QPP07716.1 hypothetical protein G4Z16_16405 [Streptomyces bathyalis]
MPRTRRATAGQQALDLLTGAPLAAARAGLFALISLALGVGAHHLLTGQPVSSARVGAAAGLLFVAGLFGARRRRSLGAVTLGCLAAQAGLHEVLGGLHVTHSAVAMSGQGHGHAAASTAVPGGGLLASHGAWHFRLQHSLTMTVAHVLVALLIAVAMHRADAACWSLTTSGAGAVALLVAAIGRMFSAWGWSPARWGPKPVPRPGLCWERSPPKTSVLADVVVRRGPPQGFGIA